MILPNDGGEDQTMRNAKTMGLSNSPFGGEEVLCDAFMATVEKLAHAVDQM